MPIYPRVGKWYDLCMEELSSKQQAFVREYVVDFNATAAAIRAGYTKRSATVAACRLIANDKIQTAIKQHTDAATSACIMEYAEACEILTSMARGHIGHYMGVDGGIDRAAIVNEYPQAVQSVDVVTLPDGGQVTKLRLNDRVRALERLAKLRGWDRPAQVQTEDVTPVRHDLSRLTDDELAAYEALLAKVAPA